MPLRELWIFAASTRVRGGVHGAVGEGERAEAGGGYLGFHRRQHRTIDIIVQVDPRLHAVARIPFVGCSRAPGRLILSRQASGDLSSGIKIARSAKRKT